MVVVMLQSIELLDGPKLLLAIALGNDGTRRVLSLEIELLLQILDLFHGFESGIR